MDPKAALAMYRSKDSVEKLFSSMKSDIGIRPIRTWTENGVYGVLLIAFLAQAMVSVTRNICEPSSSLATKFITDPMQKLTLTTIVGRNGRRTAVFSNFDPVNTTILRTFGLLEGEQAGLSESFGSRKTSSERRWFSGHSNCQFRAVSKSLDETNCQNQGRSLDSYPPANPAGRCASTRSEDPP